jgi:hypothetical protein
MIVGGMLAAPQIHSGVSGQTTFLVSFVPP